MKLLVNESPLIVLPTLAEKIGLDCAMLLQQLHFRLQHQGVEREHGIWYCQSYVRWQKQLPFWSESKIKRLFLNLEKLGLVRSTTHFNQFYVDRTKWYSIDYEAVEALFCADVMQNEPPNVQQETLPMSMDEHSEQVKNERSNNKELKECKDVTWPRQIDAVLTYLNDKAKKSFNVKTAANRKYILARLRDGYVLDDFYRVIDEQVKCWLHDPEMRKYLRPSTLFRPANFESYLSNAGDRCVYTEPKPVELDYSEGEE